MFEKGPTPPEMALCGGADGGSGGAVRLPDLEIMHWHLAHCSPTSPGWRAYMLPRVLRILDTYGLDGLYCDLGYLALHQKGTVASPDEVPAFEESPAHEGPIEDLLGILHGEVKRRGGIFKVHRDGNLAPATRSKLYDYLWVGEGINNADQMREARLKRLMAEDGFQELAELWRADCLASGGTDEPYEALMARYRAMGREVVRPPPLISGNDLIDLGLDPGPIFREILDEVYDAQLEGRAASKDEAMALAKKIAAERCPKKS
jgi:hypothetical protein